MYFYVETLENWEILFAHLVDIEVYTHSWLLNIIMSDEDGSKKWGYFYISVRYMYTPWIFAHLNFSKMYEHVTRIKYLVVSMFVLNNQYLFLLLWKLLIEILTSPIPATMEI